MYVCMFGRLRLRNHKSQRNETWHDASRVPNLDIDGSHCAARALRASLALRVPDGLQTWYDASRGPNLHVHEYI